MTRNALQTVFEKTFAAIDCDVEVTISESRARGPFLSVFGLPKDCDKAREVIEAAGNAPFVDRDVDDEDPEVVDFYSLA